MGVLSWLRSIGKPWLGDRRSSPVAAAELERDKARVRSAAASGRVWFLPYVDSLTGDSPAVRKAQRQMLKEPSVKAALLDKVLSVAALDLAVNPGDKRLAQNKVAAEFGKHLIERLTGGEYGLTGLPAFVETVFLPGLIDGFSIAEKVWYPERRGKWSGKLLLRLKSKDPERDLGLEVDEFNNITGLLGLGPNTGQRFDTSGFILWRHLSIFDNPAGMSDLRAAYRAYFLMDTAWKLRGIFLEKFSAGPMLKGTYTNDGAQKSQLDAALEQARANTWLSIPEGAAVEALDLAMRGTADFKSCIDDLKHEVFLGISGAILQALEGSTTEGRGSSAVHKSTADVRKWHIKANVESVLNSQVLPDATDLNFAGVDCPRASLGGVDDTELAASLTVDKGLLNDLKLELSREEMYERYGRSQPLDEADKLKPPENAAPPGGMPFAEQPRPAPAQPPAPEVPVAAPFREAGHTTSWGYTYRRED